MIASWYVCVQQFVLMLLLYFSYYLSMDTFGSGTPTLSVSSSNGASMQIITTKLNESNYLLWTQVMKVFLGGRKELKFITSDEIGRASCRERVFRAV